ncbi:MAG: HK97 family phage prohead protease [Thauera sp.]|jgi:HK97 family phage prohead protease|nr:HK97 family phage prohead protease [Thauera sp.]
MDTTQGRRKAASSFADLEKRAWGEFRASDEEGVIEGYVTKWGIVDSYNSTFQRGCFTKTLQERGKRVRVLWNHEEEPIGVPLELREDDVGLFARIKLILSVRRAQEAYDLAKAGAIDSFSFGFRTIKDAWQNGVRQIKEVALYEVSPVIFPANEQAQFTGVRSMEKQEKRAEDFARSLNNIELPRRHSLLIEALDWTLLDIFWDNVPDANAVREKAADALAKFTAAYNQYISDYDEYWNGSEERSMPEINELAHTMRTFLSTRSDNSPEALAADTSLTVAEVRTLLRGGVGVAETKLADLPEEVRKAFAKARASALEQACNELRNGISPAERSRLLGLLDPQHAVDETRSLVASIESAFSAEPLEARIKRAFTS